MLKERKKNSNAEYTEKRRVFNIAFSLSSAKLSDLCVKIFIIILFTACDNPWATDVLPPRGQTGALVTKPVVIGLPDPESITVGLVDMLSSTNQEIEYAISIANNANPDTLSWQLVNTFHGLTSGTAYYVYARSKQNPNYEAGDPNISDLIRFYTVFFLAPDADGGVPPSPQTVLEETIITLPDWGHEDNRLHKNGASFGNWTDGSVDYIPGYQYKVTHDQNMYVKWLPAQTFTINFGTWPTALPSGTITATSIIISQTGNTGDHLHPFNATITIPSALFAQAASVEWRIEGLTTMVLGTGQSIEIDARDPQYNIPGAQRITLLVYLGLAPYSYIFEFEVTP